MYGFSGSLFHEICIWFLFHHLFLVLLALSSKLFWGHGNFVPYYKISWQSTCSRTVEIPCPTCSTWPQFIQDKLKISIYLFLDKYKFMFKVNTILYFIFWLIITSSYVAMKTVWILISWLLQKPADLDLHRLQDSSHRVSYFERVKVQKGTCTCKS